MSEQEKFFKSLNEMLNIVAIIAAIYFVLKLLPWSLDATDAGVFDRSGLKLHVDNETKIHYLSDGEGGLIIRQGDYSK